jgi:bifunctional non-homologous end joining protein LigD
MPSERALLREYHKKRDFSKTPEPAQSKPRKRPTPGSRFVVQMHRATRLHFDFRLEAGGALKSWAVPKGPSMNPSDKRLAMQVEDHPLDYANFEGRIPKGNYGAGEVIVWDNGTYETLDKSDPARSIAAGSIKFELHGKKLRGAFALVKMRSRDGEERAWLLVKERDRFASRSTGDRRDDRSVLTKRTLADIAENPRARKWYSNRPASDKSTAPSVELKRPDKVLFPGDGYTKEDLASYYDTVAQWMLPHIEDRPLSLERFPDGIGRQAFFEKNVPRGAPTWVRTEAIAAGGNRGTVRYIICNDRSTLAYLANLAAITLHEWTSRTGSLDQPDFAFFDLDPGERCSFGRLARVAVALRDVLEGIRLKPVVKTSGGSGLHVLVPLEPSYDYDVVRSFGELIARRLAAQLPDDVTLERSTARRPASAVYFDFVQIGRGKTIVTPYTVRARPGAPVSMPITWSQVEKWQGSRARNSTEAFREWTIATVPKILRRTGDPWHNAFARPRDLEAALKAARKSW